MKRALVLLIACCASMVLLAQQPHWTPVDEGLYSGSTGIIAVIQMDGVEQTSTQMELAAFCGDECRGTAFTSEFPITHRYLAMLNVYGENGHELTFKAYDHATNQELLDMNPVVTVVFSEDGSGSLFEPLELNFGTAYEITVSANPTAGGTVVGGGAYSQGATCTLTATANTGYTFMNWKKGNTVVSSNATYSFTVTEAASYTANFSLNSYTIAATANPAAGGTVSGAGNYNHGASCTLIATPATGYTFTKWTKDNVQVSTNANYTFTVTDSGSYVAVFTKNTYSISASANPSTGGSVTGSGVYNYGESCTLTAIANTGYTFVNWTESGLEVSSNSTYTFGVIESRNLVANFNQEVVIENITFADANVKSLCVTNWDTDGDGELSYVEAASVVNIGEVFKGNSTITSFDEFQYFTGVTTINTKAFYSCSGLTSIKIPNSVVTIGDKAFNNCSSLAQIIVAEDNAVYDSRNNCNAIIKTNTNKLIAGCKNTVIPNTVTSIGYYSFSGSHYLLSIEIPNSVTTIESGAFYYCSRLSSIEIPNSVTIIKNGAFASSGLTMVTIGNAVETIETQAFYDCSSIASLTVFAETPPALQTGTYGHAFFSVNKNIPVYVPIGTIPVYQSAMGWSEFTNYQEMGNQSFDIMATANPTNGGSVTGSGNYSQGATCTLTATPTDGYTFVNWTEDGETVSTNANYSFEVTGARNLVANFALQGPITNHWIPIQTFENTMDGIGIVLIDGVEQQSAALELGIFCGEECRGSVLPEEEDDHWFYYFSMGGVTGETFTFRLYDHASQQELELTCFNEVPFEINAFLGDWDEPYEFLFSNNVLVTVSVNPEGAGEVTGAGEYPHGTTATLSATANTGFAFKDWSIDGETVSTEPTLTLTVEAPILVTANFDYVQEYSLSTGWNWWSSYVELSDIDGLTMLEEGLGESGVMIKTNGSYARRRPNNTWFGSLNSINNETGYKIQTSSNCTVVVRGSLADPADHPIAINASGWTWIGYPVQASQSANAALSGFNPENKDMIKGQNGYARYDANSGTWKPSSFTLTPGKSYLYYSNATETKSLVWNAGRSTFSDPEHHWTPNQTFENTMDGIGIVVIDGEEQFTGDLELGIFCGDDCRGSVFAEDEGDHWFYYFSMGGVSGETFTFRLYNHATQEELDLVCNNEAVPFEINGFLGDWDVPYVIDFTSNSTQTFTLPITGYGNSAGGYYLIAPPVDDVDPAQIEGMTEGDFDLYYFDQSENGEEWRNYWAEPFNLESGKGYLYAHKTDVTLTFSGAPYNGDGQVTLSKTEGVPFAGWNLVGNPFAQTATIDRDCYVMNADGTEIIASNVRTVNPMQGIFVIATSDNETMTFVPQSDTDESAIIVLNVSKNRAGILDRAIVRFEGDGTLPKLMLNPNNTKVYIVQDGKDYAVANVGGDGVHTISTDVCFKARENGTYTLNVDIVNLDLDYLHLIDNKTGADVDLLQTPSYTFEAHTIDYAERFNLVYAATTGIEEESEPIAYYADGQIHLMVETCHGASLQIVDMSGRVLVSRDASHASAISTTGMAPGVYVLRLINGDEVKTQKMVVR